MQSAARRAQIESALGARSGALLTFPKPPDAERVLSGYTEVDALTGGLPRGGLTEIYGAASSGRASLGLSVLAQLTARGEACAWVDASDSLDPCSVQKMGAELRRLLWVRCQSLEQAVQATDLLLQGGGFGLVALNLCGVARQALHRMPFSFWFRFRQVVRHTPVILLVLGPEPCARSSASLALRLETEGAYWSAISGQVRHSYLLQGSRYRAEVIRSRFRWSPGAASAIRFRTETPWDYRKQPFEAL